MRQRLGHTGREAERARLQAARDAAGAAAEAGLEAQVRALEADRASRRFGSPRGAGGAPCQPP